MPPTSTVMMDVDPRLQSYNFNNPNFGFPPHPASGPYDANVNPYALNLDQQTNGLPALSPPRRAAARNAAQGSPRAQGQSVQAASLNQRLSSPSGPIPSPRRQTASIKANNTKQNTNSLVFKNSTSSFPQGVPAAIPTDSSIFALSMLPQPPSNLHHNTNEDYFSSQPYHQPPSPHPLTPPSTHDSANPFSSSFPLLPDPPDLATWRERLYNISAPIHLSQSQFLTYFPHIDNVYSHRSTQKYKRKPFLSQYWDCRLKGRPSGTKKSQDPNVKRRKREKRELGLCDVKIKITEWFSREEAAEMGLQAVALGEGEAVFDSVGPDGLQIVLEGVQGPNATMGQATLAVGQGRWPKGHPGADGKKWYTIQRVNGSANAGGKKGEDDDEEEEDDGAAEAGEGRNLDHKHTLEESDRIKKNSVQRWVLKEDKERRSSKKSKVDPSLTFQPSHHHHNPSLSSHSSVTSYLASGPARTTVRLHAPTVPTHLTFFANAFCPFAQRVWIALELKNIAYQLVEITPDMLKGFDRDSFPRTVSSPPRGVDIVGFAKANGNGSDNTGNLGRGPPQDLLSVNPDAIIPCIKHGNWGIWESNVMMEYLEDLSLDGSGVGGTPLLPVRQPQLKAHCRLWVDHVNRKVLPAFYALLLTPPPRRRSNGSNESVENRMDVDVNGNSADPNADGSGNGKDDEARNNRHCILVDTLQTAITKLVNASHATGPFFLGDTISYVDVAFAPWIIRLSRVLSYYRNFPRPEVGTRWQSWVDAIESDERVRRTVSEERSYHGVYRGVGDDGIGVVCGPGRVSGERKVMVEIEYAKKIMGEEGFGLGGDLYGKMGLDPSRDGVTVSGK